MHLKSALPVYSRVRCKIIKEGCHACTLDSGRLTLPDCSFGPFDNHLPISSICQLLAVTFLLSALWVSLSLRFLTIIPQVGTIIIHILQIRKLRQGWPAGNTSPGSSVLSTLPAQQIWINSISSSIHKATHCIRGSHVPIFRLYLHYCHIHRPLTRYMWNTDFEFTLTQINVFKKRTLHPTINGTLGSFAIHRNRCKITRV